MEDLAPKTEISCFEEVYRVSEKSAHANNYTA
jgi:hypothetical protein